MPTVRFGAHSAASRPADTALAMGLLLAAACSNDRPTEANPGAGPEFTTTSVNCANGCKDTFTDADGTLLTAHAPDVGGFTWSLVQGFGSGYAAKIQSNAVGAEGADTLDAQFLYLIPEIVGLDSVEIEFEVLGDPLTFQGHYTAFIALRGNGTPTGGYRIWVQVNASVQRTFLGFDRNQEPLPPATGSLKEVPHLIPGVHKLRAEASGGTLKAYLDGVLVNSVTDPSPLPPGNPGFGFVPSVQVLGAEAQMRITTFEVKPCPPSGDSVLESKAVRDGLIAGLSASGPNLPFLQRKEHGGIIYRMPDRSYFVEDIPNQLLGAAVTCGYLLGTSNSPPGGMQVAVWHTHPHLPNDKAYNCKAGDPVSGAKPYTVDPRLNGGGSDADWEATTPDFPNVYVINSLGEIIRLDYGVPKGPLRTQNKNRWAIATDGSGCLKRRT